jgi:hypothetical protein
MWTKSCLEMFDMLKVCLCLAPFHNIYLQSCTQFALPMQSDGKSDMFYPQVWSDEDFAADCEALYGVRPQMEWGATEMGGAHYEYASNIIFSNGGRDPW